MRTLSALVCAGLVGAAGLAASGADGAAPPRYAPYRLALEGKQMTTWQSRGTLQRCLGAAGAVPFEGSGTQTLTFALRQPFVVPAVPGRPPRFSGTLEVDGQRDGTFVLHRAAVPGCGSDLAAVADQCGPFASKLSVEALPAGSHLRLRSADATEPGRRCAWLASDVADDGSPSTLGSAASRHPEGRGLLLPIDLAGLVSPIGGPLSRPFHAEDAWHETVTGGALDVATVLDVTVRAELIVLLVPGRSIAGVRLGATYAQVRARFGSALQPSEVPQYEGMVNGQSRASWNASLILPFEYPDRGRDQVLLVFYGRDVHGGSNGPPPASARVTLVQADSSLELSAGGLGVGSTYADLRAARPRGHVERVAHHTFWVVPGGGRRVTAFHMVRGAAKAVAIGCHGPGRTSPLRVNLVC